MEPTRRDLLKLAAAMTAAEAGLASQTMTAARAADTAPGTTRLITFRRSATVSPTVGIVLNDDTVVDLADEAEKAGRKLSFDPRSMISLVTAGQKGLDEIKALTAAPTQKIKLSEVTLLAPIPVPARNVYAVGWNYLEHFAEGQAARKTDLKYPEHPVFFTKGSHTINGPYDPIPFDPAVSIQIDWEGELAVVIGKRGRNIAEADAMDYVYGYSVINDTTARDMQTARHGGQWFKGKSLDGHGPMGPWLIPKDGINPDNLSLVTRVNGVVKQEANTAQMYFKVPRIISELSLGLTLEPGDIIATGTPPGVGFARKPPEFMKPGDVMETEISGIGLIRNTIKAV